jgi:glycosyltransferase involved in cell wall biosynthesis
MSATSLRAANATILHTEASVGFGGQEVRILAETRWLNDHGWPAVIAAQPASRLLREAAAAGVPTRAVAMPHTASVPALLRLRRLMGADRAALVHTHSSVDSWLGTLAARSRRLPVVRSRHVSIPIGTRRALIYRLADRVITSGSTVKAMLEAAGVAPERVVAIPAGIDAARFHGAVSGERVRAELGLGTAAAVGLVANIRGSKGHQYFLEAAPPVLAERPDTRFVIVGDGVGFDDVRRRVAALGLSDSVVMTGFRRDVPEVMAALDVLVLPSVRSEAFPQVIPQALAVGTPVIGTAVGGIPEIVRDGETGRLVPPADAPALARAILDVLRDPEPVRAMTRRGQALVKERFTFEASMRATVAVYEALLAR